MGREPGDPCDSDSSCAAYRLSPLLGRQRPQPARNRWCRPKADVMAMKSRLRTRGGSAGETEPSPVPIYQATAVPRPTSGARLGDLLVAEATISADELTEALLV